MVDLGMKPEDFAQRYLAASQTIAVREKTPAKAVALKAPKVLTSQNAASVVESIATTTTNWLDGLFKFFGI
jgi:hypothetical protein